MTITLTFDHIPTGYPFSIKTEHKNTVSPDLWVFISESPVSHKTLVAYICETFLLLTCLSLRGVGHDPNDEEGESVTPFLPYIQHGFRAPGDRGSVVPSNVPLTG